MWPHLWKFCGGKHAVSKTLTFRISFSKVGRLLHDSNKYFSETISESDTVASHYACNREGSGEGKGRKGKKGERTGDERGGKGKGREKGGDRRRENRKKALSMESKFIVSAFFL